MKIRVLTQLSEFEACLELQRDGFGWADVDLMPIRFFVVTHHVGGVVLGAYDGDRMVAFLSAIPGVRPGISYWHSHMLAVAKDYRDKGVGAKLKLAQRDLAIQRGIPLIEWTFDPLESRNAYFNIHKLGVIVRRYHADHYGSTTGTMQGGLPSDRVVAEWWLMRPRFPLIGEFRWVTIPADIQSLKATDLELARSVQTQVREEFLRNAADDYFAAGFERRGDWSHYVFCRGASRVHQAD